MLLHAIRSQPLAIASICAQLPRRSASARSRAAMACSSAPGSQVAIRACASAARISSIGIATCDAGSTCGSRVVTSRTQFGPPRRNGRSCASRQTSSTTSRMRASPISSREICGGGVDIREAGTLHIGREHLDQIHHQGGDVVTFLADCDPQDAVGEFEPDIGVVAQIVRQNRLAVAAGAAQGGRQMPRCPRSCCRAPPASTPHTRPGAGQSPRGYRPPSTAPAGHCPGPSSTRTSWRQRSSTLMS